MKLSHSALGVLVFTLILADVALARETRNLRFSANLDERSAVTSEIPDEDATYDELQTASQFSTEIGIVDSLGHTHVGRLYFFHIAVPDEPAIWNPRLYLDGSDVGGTAGTPQLVTEFLLHFNADRQQVVTTSGPWYAQWANGAHPTLINLWFGNFTNLDSPSVMTLLQQDGCVIDCAQSGGLDFDGDARDDLAIYRPEFGLWAIRKSSTGNTDFVVAQWGLPGDYPMTGDYTGDGRADLVVWRPTLGWWFVCSSDNDYECGLPHIEAFGLPGDRPLSGDYDGDGIFDYGVFRPGLGLFIHKSSRSGLISVEQWGLPTDIPLGAKLNQ